MLKKKILVVLLTAVILLTAFARCGSQAAEDSGGIKTFSNGSSRKALRILVDLGGSGTADDSVYYVAMKNYVKQLEADLGIENVLIEYLPSGRDSVTGHLLETDLAIRSTAIDRLRVEIMSGGGPDLFLMTYLSTHYGVDGLDVDTIDALFKYPEEAMENGLFLPLDDYMENHTEYAEWDKFTAGVMAAGRNEEGQQIIPMSYSIPLVIVPKTEMDFTPTRLYTYHDLLTAPELSPYGSDMANCNHNDKEAGEYTEPSYFGSYLAQTLGALADYQTEELLFTEEELLQRVLEILALDPIDQYTELDWAEEWFASLHLSKERYTEPMTMIPLYSDDGGVTATINTYAAINRNTQKPEEAFRVLDYTMSFSMQKKSDFHESFITSSMSLPMHEDLLRDEEHWLSSIQYYMTPENYAELCEVRDQITGAHFDSELTAILSDVLSSCAHAEYFGKTAEEVVHEAYENMQRRLRE